jgi:hypothetical protein
MAVSRLSAKSTRTELEGCGEVNTHTSVMRFEVNADPLDLEELLALETAFSPDTTARQDGDTLRVEIGRAPAWRMAFIGRALGRMERIVTGRIEQTVVRTDSTRIVYRQPAAGRTLTLTIRRFIAETAFDAAIWRP